MVKHGANFGKCPNHKGDLMRVFCPNIQPHHIVFFCRVFPDVIRSKCPYIHMGEGIGRPANFVNPESDNISVLSQPVHVIFRCVPFIPRNQANSPEAIGVGLQTMLQILVVRQLFTANLRQYCLIDPIGRHDLQQFFRGLCPVCWTLGIYLAGKIFR